MDFEFTKEQADIQRAAHDFAEAEFNKDYLLDVDRNHKFPWEVWKKAIRLGFVGLEMPEEYGGQGYGIMERVLVAEQFCRCGAGAGISVLGTYFGSRIILKKGTEEQKRKYIPSLMKGEAISAGAFTEPDRGSDLISGPLSTTAVKEGGDYIINGTKTLISYANLAKFVTVLCQTDPDIKPPYHGHSTIVVEMDRAGIEVSEMEKMGWKTSPCCEVSFMNVKVPRENLVGEEGRGFYQTIEFLDEGRINIGSSALGIAQGSFERALQYAKLRDAFGHKIGTFQAISHKLAEMATKIEVIRLLIYKAACEYDRGKPDPKLSSMAKWFPARVAVEVADDAIQIFGGYGYMVENEVERFYRDARVLELYEGTREIHKNTIARFLLGRLK